MTLEDMSRLVKRRDPEAEYVTMCYYIQKEFGLSIKEMKQMPASTFRILIEEMQRDYKKQQKEMESARGR